MAYAIEFTAEAEDHFKRLTARQRATLVDRIERQLLHEPGVETRNRKPMRPNPLAPWELRVGALRVYYETNDDPAKVVTVRAIGVKSGNRVRIGDEWWEASGRRGSDEDAGDEGGDR